MISYNILSKYSEIAHFCSTRNGGASVGNYASNNLSPFTGDDAAAVLANQTALTETLQIPVQQLIIPFQNHGTEAREIDTSYFQLDAKQQAAYLDGVDALFTTMPNICIGITTADCVPLLFFDPVKKVIAAAHAGWRGTCGRIAEKTVCSMIEKYHCNPSDIIVTIGPSISSQVYEVGQDVVEKFKQNNFEMDELVEIRNDAIFLDLWAANKQCLLATGVLPQHIEIAGICTYTDHEKFFSARRLGIKSGRILSGIMLKRVI